MVVNQMQPDSKMAAARAPVAAAANADMPLRVLRLHHARHDDAVLHRFSRGTRLQFRPGPDLLGRKVFLYTNYVITDDPDADERPEFVRNQYYALEWRAVEREDAELAPGDDMCVELVLRRAGAYHYYFVYDTAESPLGPQGSGWFQVEPELQVGGERLPLDAVSCQTVLTKCLGPLPRWEGALRVAREAGYNMVHFTPVQRLGASGSCYSIADQLRLDPRYASPSSSGAAAREPSFADLENVVAKMRNEWKTLAICDVVLNHTANETPWLSEHPEATYNCRDCPHLRPAALLDAALARLSADVARGLVAGAPRGVAEEVQLVAVRAEAERRVQALRLHELFQCDVPALLLRFRTLAAAKVPTEAGAASETGGAGGAGGGVALRLCTDPARRRLRATVDMEQALHLYNVHRPECGDEEARLAASCLELKRALEALNEGAEAEVASHLRAALDNCDAGVRYERLQADGPRLAEVSEAHPIFARYFTFPVDLAVAPWDVVEACVQEGVRGALVQAHNGWVMGCDPLEDFAAKEAGGRVYLRRELLAWGDSVKLRYGASPDDCPFLWRRMREYVELTAEVFAGLRLDNCHSTPLHVAEYMLDAARNVKPDLYVVAELFTDSDRVDNVYVNRLGITSLIREAQSAWDARELGRLLHRYGGRPVGAFLPRPGGPDFGADASQSEPGLVARALLMDLTHDNPSPLTRRSIFDILPTAALTAVACCGAGSTRGLDELVPHSVHVVDEERLYREWGEGEGRVGPRTGLVAARAHLNRLHAELARAGYDEVYVDQMDDDVVAVTRHDPRSRRSLILVAVTAFRSPPEAGAERTPPPLRFEGDLAEIALEACLRHADPRRPHAPPALHRPHPRLIDGLADYECDVRTSVPLQRSAAFASERREGDVTVLEFRPLPPGFVVAVRVSPRADTVAALAAADRSLADLRSPASPAAAAFADLDLADLNALLYRCDAEERDAGGGGVYDVPGFGPLAYAGLQGAGAVLDRVRRDDDLGHPLCANLRAGDWLADYTSGRLEREPRLRAAAAVVGAALRPIAGLPRFLRPAYFEALHGALLTAARRVALARLPSWLRSGELARALALTSVQLTARVPSAPLPPLAAPSDPPPPSLSAGLPHFTTGYMRCWGRDIFVALRGMFLLTGRYDDARAHILGFASCLRHGLIPNLLDGGVKPRFNCRDAVWWWLQSVQQYCEEAPAGHSLLTETVLRLFPTDEAAGDTPAPQLLHDVVQEALEAHFEGRAFRERNAGPGLDAHMTDRGFNVQVGVHPETGFPFGGNDANCGTWMDKMGSSERAGTRGRPATPRDGSAVEITALCYSAVRWLGVQHAAGRYPHGVVGRPGARWTWRDWAERLRRNFERHYWVPASPSASDARPDLVHRRAIYKDSHGASQPWADYQLRCNFVVAMAVAPDLFDPKHAWLALDAVERHLLGPLGVKTLDPADWNYRPDYDNSDDSDDPAVAHGFNYHQGPEWTWPLGFYLRARLIFAAEAGRQTRTAAAVLRALAPLAAEIESSPWRGLPELTNAGGKECPGSCRSQAWSSATALEALHAVRAARRATALD